MLGVILSSFSCYVMTLVPIYLLEELSRNNCVLNKKVSKFKIFVFSNINKLLNSVNSLIGIKYLKYLWLLISFSYRNYNLEGVCITCGLFFLIKDIC